MKEELNEIYDINIPHSSFLSKTSIDKCMIQSYILGKKEREEEYNKLKITFEQLLSLHLNQNIDDLDKFQVEKNWKLNAGIL